MNWTDGTFWYATSSVQLVYDSTDFIPVPFQDYR